MTQNSPVIPAPAPGKAAGGGSGHCPVLLDSHRLQIRPARMGDVAALAATLDDWMVAQWLLLPYPIQIGDVARLVADSLEPAVPGAERRGLFSICDKADGEIAGAVVLRWSEGRPASIRYWLRPASWGKGLAGEAVTAVTAHAFAGWGVPVVRASVDPDNTRSARVLRRVGFRPVLCLIRERTNHRGAKLALVYECTPQRFRHARCAPSAGAPG